MKVEYSDVRIPKPKTEPKYIDEHKKKYGFKTKEERSAFKMGIEAASYVYGFDIKTDEYELTPPEKSPAHNWPTYIKQAIETGLKSPTPYKVIPYKNGIGIKKIKFI